MAVGVKRTCGGAASSRRMDLQRCRRAPAWLRADRMRLAILCVRVALWFWQQLPQVRAALQPEYERLGMAPEDA